MRHNGGCHCGNIHVTFESDIDPSQIKIRACQCSFCRKHGAEAISDPSGQLTINIADQDQLIRYKFGYEITEFLICANCGVYVTAITNTQNHPRAILQLKTLDDAHLFTSQAVAVDYAEENQTNRQERRNQIWMPLRGAA